MLVFELDFESMSDNDASSNACWSPTKQVGLQSDMLVSDKA